MFACKQGKGKYRNTNNTRLTWCHFYCVFTVIYSLLLEKDHCYQLRFGVCICVFVHFIRTPHYFSGNGFHFFSYFCVLKLNSICTIYFNKVFIKHTVYSIDYISLEVCIIGIVGQCQRPSCALYNVIHVAKFSAKGALAFVGTVESLG